MTNELPLRPGLWALDANHSSIGFTVRHLGVSKVRGTFRDFAVEVVVGDSPETSSVTATIDVASLDTGNPDRDAHVLSPDLIDVAQRPTMTYRSTAIHGSGDDWTVEGELTLGDVSQPATLAVELGGVQEFPADGRRHAGFEATAQIRRTDYGIDIALPPGVSGAMLGDVIKIELDLQLLEPVDAPVG
jgi:polyisoprenoid-binding protein YceI